MARNIVALLLLFFCFQVFAQDPRQNPAGGKISHWSFSAYGGYSLMLNKVHFDLGDEFAGYMKRLKSGWHTGMEADYFINRYLGAGISYAVFFTSASQDSLTATNGFFTLTGNVSDKMYIHNMAPVLIGRLPLFQGKLLLTGGVGPVYLNYHNVGKALTDSAAFKGSSPGALGKFSAQYTIARNLYLGINSSYTYAFLKKLTKVTLAGEEIILLEKGDYQNISRFDAALCFRWMFL